MLNFKQQVIPFEKLPIKLFYIFAHRRFSIFNGTDISLSLEAGNNQILAIEELA